jgi:hypothetical protein
VPRQSSTPKPKHAGGCPSAGQEVDANGKGTVDAQNGKHQTRSGSRARSFATSRFIAWWLLGLGYRSLSLKPLRDRRWRHSVRETTRMPLTIGQWLSQINQRICWLLL